jgi:hypothetical protein
VLTPCRSILGDAKDLLDYGVVDEGLETLVRLRRCAHGAVCREWQDCCGQIEAAWSQARCDCWLDGSSAPSSRH